MGLNVPRLTRSYLNNRNVPQNLEEGSAFSVQLTDEQFAKLRFLASRFGVGRDSVAQNLLDAAMEDALRILGAFDAMTDEETQEVEMDDQNEFVDEQVERYRDEIRRLLQE